MELRWYWRILRRQWQVIAMAAAIVAVLAAGYSIWSYLGSSYKAQVTIQFFQPLPVIGGKNAAEDPQAIANGAASDARDEAKSYTETITYFKDVSSTLKQDYGRNVDWKVISANLGATVTEPRSLFLEYAGSNGELDKQVLVAAVARLQKDFLPTYQVEHQSPASSLITIFPVQLRLLTPIDGRPASKTSVVLGWLLKVVIGVVLGVVLAFLWEYIDESIHDEQDVRTWMNLPTLGVNPSTPRQNR
jgi:capsular polysaccharide biosynthesis protein